MVISNACIKVMDSMTVQGRMKFTQLLIVDKLLNVQSYKQFPLKILLQAPFALSVILLLVQGNDPLKSALIESRDSQQLSSLNFPKHQILQLCLDFNITTAQAIEALFTTLQPLLDTIFIGKSKQISDLVRYFKQTMSLDAIEKYRKSHIQVIQLARNASNVDQFD